MKLIVEMDMPESCPCDLIGIGYAMCCSAANSKKRIVEYDECVKSGTKPDWCPIKGVLPEEHGDLVDFNDVSKELRKYGYIVEDETTGMKHMEYPIVLEQNPISIPIIVPAERKDDGIKQI